MTISNNLLLAIFAMDAYNRGGSGFNLTGPQIGDALLITRQSANVTDLQYQGWQTFGFFAQAYDLGGKTVIAYRGTDEFADLAAWQ